MAGEEERSDQAFYAWMDLATKLDYFLAGVCLTATGYLATTIEPTMLALNAATLEVAAVLLLLVSSIASLKRVEAAMVVLSGTHRQLRESDRAGKYEEAAKKGQSFRDLGTGEAFTPARGTARAAMARARARFAKESSDDWAASAWRWYKWRNRFLYAGLVAYIAAQVLSAYGW